MIDKIISKIEKYGKILQVIQILLLMSVIVMYITMSMVKPSEMHILQVSLVAGIVLLSMNDKEGWGWLVFILLCTI